MIIDPINNRRKSVLLVREKTRRYNNRKDILTKARAKGYLSIVRLCFSRVCFQVLFCSQNGFTIVKLVSKSLLLAIISAVQLSHAAHNRSHVKFVNTVI